MMCPRAAWLLSMCTGLQAVLPDLEGLTYLALLQVCAVGLYPDLAGSFTAALAEPAIKPEQVGVKCCHAMRL